MIFKRLRIKKMILIIVILYLLIFAAYLFYLDTFKNIDESRERELTEYISNGELDKLKDMLKKHPQIVNQDHFLTPLQIAAYHGNLEIVEMLVLSMDADINLRDENPDIYHSDSMPPITLAVVYAMGNNSEEATNVILFLLQHGADLSIKDYYGKTAYDYAIEKGYTDLAELIENYQSGCDN